MTRRAVVVAAQIEGLKGSDLDAKAMADTLVSNGFDVDHRVGPAATRASILAAYDALIAKSQRDDAAVFYFSGHGFYAPADDNRAWQCICPWDLRAGSADDWRGITAWELSIKQRQLTEKTSNVTVILDCCHASQMSRDTATREAFPKGLPHPVKVGFAQHLAALRATYGAAFDAVDLLGNRNAVRLVACGEAESAFEYRNRLGEHRSVFTEMLVEVLGEVGVAPITWAAVMRAVRARVMRKFVTQRPDVEGPASRRLFDVVEQDSRGHVAVIAVGDRYELPVGRLMGVERGDIYAVMPIAAPAYDEARAVATLRVDEVRALSAIAVRADGSEPISTLDTYAVPILDHQAKTCVAIDVPDTARGAVEAAIVATGTLRVADTDDVEPLARLRLVDDRLTIEDDRGPLFLASEFPAELDGTIRNLANLALAQRLRELEGEHGIRHDEVEVELGRVIGGAATRLPDRGAALTTSDRIYVRVNNVGSRTLVFHVFNVGIRGQISLLSSFAASGVVLEPGAPALVLGKDLDDSLVGLELVWPDRMPDDGFARLDEIVVIVTTTRMSLAALETEEFTAKAALPKQTRLQRIVAQFQDGNPRSRASDSRLEGFLVKRLAFLLRPPSAS